jgi:type IV secretion system protein VirB2
VLSGAECLHNATCNGPLEVLMNVLYKPVLHCRAAFVLFVRRNRPACVFFALVALAPALALAQSGSPFDTGFTALQTLFTGTIAKVASLIAIVIGGYEFAHGAPGAKKTLAGVAAGTGIAVLATNVLSWLWGM